MKILATLVAALALAPTALADTHGDVFPPNFEAPAFATRSTASAPVCASRPHFVTILVSSPGFPQTITPATLRGMVGSADGDISSAATASGGNAHLRVECNTVGEIAVHETSIPVTNNFFQVISELTAQGFTGDKYIVYYSVPAGGICGQSNVYFDESPGPSNQANGAGSFALSWNCQRAIVFPHELGHSLGAVQNGAPHSSGAYHCYEQGDLMCYIDGGPYFALGGKMVPCPDTIVFDCGSDDYFAGVPKGTYLSTHWNTYNNVYLDQGPLPVSLRWFSARRVSARTVLRWRTASEFNVVGFGLYAGSQRLTKHLIPAKSTSGAKYAFTTKVNVKQYRLKAVDQDGSVRWYLSS